MPVFEFLDISSAVVTGSPVVGGSGATYPTIAAAIAGETEDAATTFAPQVGTAPGVVVGLALSAVDDFYKDYWIVNEDPTPTNGLQCRYARVSKYVGATQTLTIDQPWDFAAESVLRLIQPIRISILNDIAEDVTFTKNVEFDLAGHRLLGKIDQTAGTFCWIREGWVTNGIQKTTLGVLRLDDLSVSRRDDTLYAVLMTDGSDLGRTVLQNCRFFGVVAGRRGRAGWEIDGCRNYGLPEGSPTNRNIPYRLFESVAGVAIVVVQADVQVNGEWSGAVFYSENSLTGATAALSIRIDAKAQKLLTAVVTPEQPVYSFLYCSVGAATLTMTWVANSTVSMTFGQSNSSTFSGLNGFSLFIDFTGVFNVSGGNISPFFISDGANLAHIQVVGTVTMSGSITTASMFAVYTAPGFEFDRILLASTVSGTILDGASVTVDNVLSCIQINLFSAIQNNAAASVTISGTTGASGVQSFSTFLTGTFAISAGTWLVSGSTILDALSRGIQLAFLGAAVSGGTFTLSGIIAVTTAGTAAAGGAAVLIYDLARHAGTGGILTISSATVRISGHDAGVLFLAHAVGAGSTVVVSAATVEVRGIKRLSVSAQGLVRATTATSTASLTGALRLENCSFRSALNIVEAVVVGASVTGPSSVVFDKCESTTTLTDAIATGTVVWAAATLQFRSCQWDGLVTFVGTRFSTVEAFETEFNGSSGDKSISASGTRPATYRLWKCGYRARVEDLQPEILHDWEVRPASGALAAGQLLTINAAGQATSPAAGSVVEGVALEAVAALDDPAIMVRRGDIFVDSNAVVVAGDNCNLDAATPTQQTTGAFAAGQRVSRALEATGAVRAGEAYSVVNLG